MVWRRGSLFPGGGRFRLSKLSEMLLATMGWTNSHLHTFLVGDKRFGMNFDEFPEGEIDEKGVTVLQAFRDERRFVYEYDFGDGWEHEVVVEELTGSGYGAEVRGLHRRREGVSARGRRWPWLCRLPRGDRRSRPRGDAAYIDWVGGSFDPADFDLGNANARAAARPLNQLAERLVRWPE